MKKVATIILNRNLPNPTNALYEHIENYDGNETDIYVLEAGSEKKNISKYCTWHVDTEEVKKKGLRYNRGMNYCLLKLFNEKKWEKYDYFFLITNDTELSEKKSIEPMIKILNNHNRVGILSPCSSRWGEKLLLLKEKTKYFWFIHNNAFFVRRTFLEDIMEIKDPNYLNFIFDGTNFRGYLSESEFIAKAYANNWAAAITSEVFAEENETYLLNKSDLIKTETYDENIRLYIEEGLYWLKKKYGFNSRWTMQMYVKSLYDSFFEFYPEFEKFRI